MFKRIGRGVTLAGVVAGISFAAPHSARAQGNVELTPFLGSFYALTKMCSDCNNDASDVRARQLNSAALGGRLTYMISNTLGIEASGSYTPSRIELSAEDTAGFAIGASARGKMIDASARLIYRPARTNLRFIVGAGIVHRGGNAWKTQHDSAGTKLTSPAAVLGVGVRAVVTPKFALLVSAEANLYSMDPMFGPLGDESNGKKLQSDVLVTIGIPIALSH
jgi:hypothetical protein